MSLIVNRRDLEFLLFDLHQTDKLFETPYFADYDRASVSAILDAAQKIAEDVYAPIAQALDDQEPEYRNGEAITHRALKPALQSYCDAGFLAAGFPQEIGGLQLPLSIQTAINGMFSCANLSAHNYMMLTAAAANLLSAFGNEQQVSRFVSPMIEGRWFGTMCLSEPQAGSSLSDIRTLAHPRSDGRYNISGSKMWISGGDQDISENIVHMVLAKTSDAPAGVKGISLFIVPKIQVDQDGNLGAKNHISLAGLNHKMGNRGTTNALLNFGETGDCVGELVGELHQGLRYMFQMMNEARIGVGHGACMQALAGYLHSLDYARQRPQGRLPDNKDPNAPQVEIIEHADIKRLLLAQKSAVEGAMALVFYCARLEDQCKVATSDAERGDIALLLDLLTPIAKSWPSEFCLEANKHAMQVLGGYGYTRDYPLERLYRDNRLNPIHEGTHAIHGIDLLGRKVRIADGKAFSLFVTNVEQTILACSGKPSLEALAVELKRALSKLQQTTQHVIDAQDVSRELSNATPYLDAFGHIVIAWLWLKQAQTALSITEPEGEDVPFLNGKQRAAEYFFEYELPKAHHQLDIVASLSQTCLDMQVEDFIGH